VPADEPEAVGVVVLRVWRERGRLVARVTTTPDIARMADERVQYCTSAEQICLVITDFLGAFPGPDPEVP
jgi:hypothetical protein